MCDLQPKTGKCVQLLGPVHINLIKQMQLSSPLSDTKN